MARTKRQPRTSAPGGKRYAFVRATYDPATGQITAREVVSTHDTFSQAADAMRAGEVGFTPGDPTPCVGVWDEEMQVYFNGSDD